MAHQIKPAPTMSASHILTVPVRVLAVPLPFQLHANGMEEKKNQWKMAQSLGLLPHRWRPTWTSRHLALACPVLGTAAMRGLNQLMADLSSFSISLTLPFKWILKKKNEVIYIKAECMRETNRYTSGACLELYSKPARGYQAESTTQRRQSS